MPQMFSKSFCSCAKINFGKPLGFSQRRLQTALFIILYLHITFRCMYVLEQCFWCHPFQRQFSNITRLMILETLINIPRQSKVRYLDEIVITDQHVTGCQITMDELLL